MQATRNGNRATRPQQLQLKQAHSLQKMSSQKGRSDRPWTPAAEHLNAPPAARAPRAAGQAPAASPPAAAMAAGNHNASASPTLHIVPAAAVQEAARRIQLVGVRLKQGSWNARVHLAVDERGRPTGATWLLIDPFR